MARVPYLWNATNGSVDNNNWGAQLLAHLAVEHAPGTGRHYTDPTAAYVNVMDPDYGAEGDGSTDDSEAFRLALAAGDTILIPPGTYRFTANPLKIIDNAANGNLRGKTLIGCNGGASGGGLTTILEWAGSTSDPFVQLYSRDCILQNLVIRVASGSTTAAIVDIDAATGSGAGTCTNNALIDCRVIEGSGAADVGIRISNTAQANCEYMRLLRCYVDLAGASTACVKIGDNANSKKHRFHECSFNSATYGIHQLRGSFTADDCTFGSLTTGILLTSSTDNIVIIDPDEESCARFLDTRGTSGSGGSSAFWPVTIEGGRFGCNSLHADGIYIHFTFGGPLTVKGGQFGSGTYTSTFKISASCAAPGSILISEGNSFSTDTPYFTDATKRYRLVSLGNRGVDSGSSAVNLGDQIVRYVSDATGTLTTQDFRVDVVATADLPAAAAAMNGRILLEDGGAGNVNVVAYARGERVRIDGGANV